MFASKSESLYDFFNQAGVAYYVPFYQRQYSWDEENVTKMMDDLYDGVRKICGNSDYLRFIGTIILFAEPYPLVTVHYDTNGLITKLYNVIDGQQRISTLSIVAILLSEELERIKIEISSNGWDSLPSVPDLVVSVENRLFELQEFFSNEVKKANVDPDRKPIIIRAFDSNSSPQADQWTLRGDHTKYYRSDVARVISHYIRTKQVVSDIDNEKLKANIGVVRDWIKKTFESKDFPDADALVDQNSSSLNGFLDGDVDLHVLARENSDCAYFASGVIKVLALVRFLTNKTYLTTIECPSEDLAFDMFQSLNATGTPLTAIEVFKPLVVNTLAGNYGASDTKRYFDIADEYFDKRKSAADKEKLTDEVLLRMSLVHDGYELGKRFSEQRDWLTREYSECSGPDEKEGFIRWLSDLTQYWEFVYQPRKPNRDSTSFNLVGHFVSLGLPTPDADLAALCVFYLKDANHAMAHYLLSLFYSKLIRSVGTPTSEDAASEFLSVCKAAAAFFTLWGGASTGFPDEAYRDLFKQGRGNISWKSGSSNQTSTFVKAHFKQVLESKGVFSSVDESTASEAWCAKAQSMLGYGKQALCRFSLFLAAHDKAPDPNTGAEGLMIKGVAGSAPYLNSQSWYSSKYEVIEHVANRDKPQGPYKYGDPDEDLYPGNYSVVDKIGNLTLWSRAANSSTYPEWPEKSYYYATLTRISPTTEADLTSLAAAQGISSVPPGLAGVAAGTGYVANLAPLAERGQKGLSWNKAVVDSRTKRITELVFEELYDWIK